MFRQFEIILTSVCLVLSAIFLILIILRVRNNYFKKNPRVPIWNNNTGALYRAGKLIMGISLPFMATGIINYIFIILMPSTMIRIYAKILFIVIFSGWVLLEVFLCLSISEKLHKGSTFRRIAFSLMIIVSIIGAAYFFPLVPKALPYPAARDCVIIDLPVRGTWLAGQAGAGELTNGHITNRYAVDILRLGPDGRLYKNKEDAVTDFYSYNEAIYAPADGEITQVQDGFESDVIGNMDKDHPGGNYIIMDIGNGKYVFFGHLRKGSITVDRGQLVHKGRILGRVGNSGYSTHPHLHLHVQNKPTSDAEGRITYPFRFSTMHRRRLILWRVVRNGALLRNDWFSD